MKTKIVSTTKQAKLRSVTTPKSGKTPSTKKSRALSPLEALRQCITKKADQAGFPQVKMQLISRTGKLIVRYQSNLTVESDFMPEFRKLGKVICGCLAKYPVKEVKGFQMKAYRTLQRGSDGPMATEPPSGGGSQLCTCDGARPILPSL